MSWTSLATLDVKIILIFGNTGSKICFINEKKGQVYKARGVTTLLAVFLDKQNSIFCRIIFVFLYEKESFLLGKSEELIIPSVILNSGFF